MSGFSDPSLNHLVYIDTLKYIVGKMLICMESMVVESILKSRRIANNEIVIRDFLFVHYLDDDHKMRDVGLDNFRFESEAPENYIDGVPQGRADLKVYSINNFRYRRRYFIIECKRIDGSPVLNREYVDKGIRRFTGPLPKYTSYFKSNCMFGFLVRAVDVVENVDRINQLLHDVYDDIPVCSYLHPDEDSGVYLSVHEDASSQITLVHAFADCSKLVT